MVMTVMHVCKNDTKQHRLHKRRAARLVSRLAALLVAAGALAGLLQPASAAWNGTPTLLESDTPNTSGPPQVAIRPSGNDAIVVWQQGPELRARVWDGTAWGAPVAIDGPGSPNAVSLAWSKSGSTRAMAFWQETVVGVGTVRAALWAGAWTSSVRVDTIDSNALDP